MSILFRKSLLVIFLQILVINAFSETISRELAASIATTFYNSHSPKLKSAVVNKLEIVKLSYNIGSPQSAKKTDKIEDELLYVFQVNEIDGFIIVSGDDRTYPILGYSYDGTISDNPPPNFLKWLELYRKQLQRIVREDRMASPEIEKLWQQLESGDYRNLNSTAAVNPLIKTKWGQSPYVNDMCPYDTKVDERTLTGCVATALAQVLKYWEYPKQGNGFHSYNHSTYGTIAANFGQTEYDWGGMPLAVSGQNDQVAELMYHCGVSVEMDYGIEASSAYVLKEKSPITHCTEYALTKYWGYHKDLKGVLRENYTAESWKNLLKDELDETRPVLYAGFGTGGGHAFICDGYDNSNFFHFNWGWRGNSDGYFLIDALDPLDLGAGGGSGGFNSMQQAIIGVKPPAGTINHLLTIYEEITLSPGSDIDYGQSFSVSTNIANDGTSEFNGDFCMAIFDEDIVFVDYVEVLEDYSLSSGYVYTNGLTFSYPGSFTLLPGDYHIFLFYHPTGEDWKVVRSTDFLSNYQSLTISHSNTLEMDTSFILNDDMEITRGQPFDVKFNIWNTEDTEFSGSYVLSLFELDGEFGEMIEHIQNVTLCPNCHYIEPITFSSAGVTLPAGTYLMASRYLPDGGEIQLTGATYYTNPVKVTVIEPPIQPDIYENNDSIISSYPLNNGFTDDRLIINTAGANIHSEDDYDYFSLELPSGYAYTITAEIFDSYHAEEGKVYTNDVIVAYVMNDTWSEVFDDIVMDDISFADGGKITFAIASYFVGELGTYNLEIEVTRTEVATSLEQIEGFGGLMVYPNPFTDELNVTLDPAFKMERIQLVNVEGQVVFDNLTEARQNAVALKLSTLQTGYYTVIVHTDLKTFMKSIVKITR